MSDFDKLKELTGESGCQKENRPWMIGWDSEVEVFYVFRPDCKCWNCEPCAARLQARWKARTFEGINAYVGQGYDFRFLTLTSHERLLTMYQSQKVWQSAWPKLRKRVQRIMENWYWVQIPEQHRDGRLHVHIITSTAFGTRWWKDNARECGLGYIAEEAEFKGKANDPTRAAAYAGKYLGKQLGVKSWPRYFHHIRTSANFPDLPENPDNPYDNVTWVAHSTKDFARWWFLVRNEKTPIFYTGNGERL